MSGIRGWVLAGAMVLVSMWCGGCSNGGPSGPGDTTAPAQTTTLAAGSHTTGSVTLTWTAPGDDGISGRATRYDIRYSSEETLRAGKGFQIIELNGAASEATNIYDARNSLFTAYRTLFQQWDLVFAIGAANRERGCAPTDLSVVWKKWREYSRLAATYPAAD